jgi:hypothetical protein
MVHGAQLTLYLLLKYACNERKRELIEKERG